MDDPCPVPRYSLSLRIDLDAVKAFYGFSLAKHQPQKQRGYYSCHTWTASSETYYFKSGNYTFEGASCSLLSYCKAYQPALSQKTLWLVRPGLNAGSGSHDKASELAWSSLLSDYGRYLEFACIWWPSFGIGSGGPTYEPDNPSDTSRCFTRQANACSRSGKRIVWCSHSSEKTSHESRV